MATQQQLDEAITARHQLMTGRRAVSVSYKDGGGQRTVEYTAANIDALDRYIAQLRRELAGKRPARSRIRYMAPV